MEFNTDRFKNSLSQYIEIPAMYDSWNLGKVMQVFVQFTKCSHPEQ